MNRFFFTAIISIVLITCYGQRSFPPDSFYPMEWESMVKGYTREAGIVSGDKMSDSKQKEIKYIYLTDLTTNLIDTSYFRELINLEILKIHYPSYNVTENNKSIYFENLNLLGKMLPKYTRLRYVQIPYPNASFIHALSQTSVNKLFISSPTASLSCLGWKELNFLSYSGSVAFFDIENMNSLDTLVVYGYENLFSKVVESDNALSVLAIHVNSSRETTVNFKLSKITSLKELYVPHEYFDSIVTIQNIDILTELKKIQTGFNVTFDSKLKKLKKLKSIDLHLSLADIPRRSFFPPYVSSMKIDFYQSSKEQEKFKGGEYSLKFMKNLRKLDTLQILVSANAIIDSSNQISFIHDKWVLKLPETIGFISIKPSIDFKSFDKLITQKKFIKLQISDYMLKSHFDAFCKSMGIDNLIITRSIGDRAGGLTEYYHPTYSYYYYKGNKQRIQQLSECLPNTTIIPENLDLDKEND